MNRDPWAEINARPSALKPFGSALPAAQQQRIARPAPITVTPKRITRPELLRAMRGVL